MELHEQIDAVQHLVEQLANTVAHATHAAQAAAQTRTQTQTSTTDTEQKTAADTVPLPVEPPRLHFHRPTQNEIVVSLGEHAVKLGPADISAIIDELAAARASMTPELPLNLPPGWRFVATQDPIIASQPCNHGGKLIILRHTGYGWVPFALSPKMIVELFAMLSAK